MNPSGRCLRGRRHYGATRAALELGPNAPGGNFLIRGLATSAHLHLVGEDPLGYPLSTVKLPSTRRLLPMFYSIEVPRRPPAPDLAGCAALNDSGRRTRLGSVVVDHVQLPHEVELVLADHIGLDVDDDAMPSLAERP